MRIIKTVCCPLLFILCLVLGTSTAETRVIATKVWPHQIPCRIGDSGNRDLFVMTLGEIEPSIAQGIYDPINDRVTLKDGSIKDHYYRDTLGTKYFKPIDKSRFPLPPSGWCSWYYYYQEISETEIQRNSRWIAENLKDYGATCVQIDDGWQGVGRGRSRDWTMVSDRFPSGMSSLASYIKSLGLVPGIWIAPHGQSNEVVVKKNPGVFLLKPDGTTASESWEGRWLVDPTTKESQSYLKNLFATMTKWGYEYFKIDGQTVVIGEYRSKKSFMKQQPEDPIASYRETVNSIREAIGPDRYLLGCWGIPIEGLGIMNGSRTGGDIVLGWNGGFMTALRATMQHYYLHNVAWYCDPDVMLLRSPLTVDQARAWATLQGLTGQALLSSDRLMDLSDERVELMRRVYPPVDIRPLDLFPSDRNKRIWDLKVNHLGRSYDVVGLFNFDESRTDQIHLKWEDFGLPKDAPVHVFDFWNKEYLGAWDAGMTVSLSPASCRVLTLLPGTDRIQLVSTSRHITQGWVDLTAQLYDQAANLYTGTSKLVKDDPYELRFVFPRGKNFVIKKATARGSSVNLPAKIANHQGWASVRIVSPRTTEVKWEILFEPSDVYHYPSREPTNLSVERVGLDGVSLRWAPQYYLNAGYQVYLNGKLLGYTPGAGLPVRGLDPNLSYSAEVQTIWEDGTASEKKAELKFTIKALLPDDILLSELEPVRTARADLSRSRAFSIGGKRYERGISGRVNSEIEYDVKGLYSSFSAQVGLDDANNTENTSAEFSIVGDGKELWSSGALKKSDGLRPAQVNIGGVGRLLLRIAAKESSNNRGQGDWVEAKLTGLKKQ